MKSCIVIRSMHVEAEEIDLFNLLKGYFGDDVFFVIEDYCNLNLEIEFSDRTIRVGRKFLTNNGLRQFKKAGWQCGDYIYYSALETIGVNYDYIWMIEPDVRLSIDVRCFFEQFEGQIYDLIGVAFGERKDNWSWFNSISSFTNNGKVYGMYFPISRVSISGLRYALSERKRYCHSQGVREIDFGAVNLIKGFANDEAFLATTLASNGFSCVAFHKITGKEIWDRFTTEIPIFAIEIGSEYLDNKILHPVCDQNKSRKKLGMLYQKYDSSIIRKKMDEILKKFGREVWLDYSGIDPEGILKNSNN